MNYEMLIERARYAAKETVCMVEPRLLNRMADALENQEKVIAGLREIIEKQGGVNLRAAQTALDLDRAYAELRDEKHRFDRLSDFEVAEAKELAYTKKLLEMARGERDAVTKRMVELEQELAQLKKEQTLPALDAGRNAPKTSIPQEVADV